MFRTFYLATSFRQVLCWDMSKVTSKLEMFDFSGGSLLQYPECLLPRCKSTQH